MKQGALGRLLFFKIGSQLTLAAHAQLSVAVIDQQGQAYGVPTMAAFTPMVPWSTMASMAAFALGGIGAPALQSLATRQVDAQLQGQFQGVLASAVSLASIVCPLAFSSFYFIFRDQWPGAIWLAVILVYAALVPLVLGLRHGRTCPIPAATT